MIIHPCRLLVYAVLFHGSILAEPEEILPKPVNFIIMLADVLGYGDLGVTGSKQIPTPHIDSLAAGGVRFTNAYVSSPVCAPSRAGLMTGRHPASFGFRDSLTPVQPGHDPEFVGLTLNQTTLADRLKKLGNTAGLVGKWHLGELPRFSPLKRGFDEFWGWLAGSHDYFKADSIRCNFKQPGPCYNLSVHGKHACPIPSSANPPTGGCDI